jgi:mRNA-degrading endonuclease toxin of MazEF toxin-antitoxin module
MPVVLPITTGGDFARLRGFAVSPEGLGLKTMGTVRCDQPQVLDLKARGARRLGEIVLEPEMAEVLARLAAILE